MTRLIRIGRKKHSGSGKPATASNADITPPRLAILPMDRSNSLMLITSVAPMEMITSSEICRVMLIKFVSVKNDLGLSTLNITIISVSANKVP